MYIYKQELLALVGQMNEYQARLVLSFVESLFGVSSPTQSKALDIEEVKAA